MEAAGIKKAVALAQHGCPDDSRIDRQPWDGLALLVRRW